jgi:hypothetical protein
VKLPLLKSHLSSEKNKPAFIMRAGFCLNFSEKVVSIFKI